MSQRDLVALISLLIFAALMVFTISSIKRKSNAIAWQAPTLLKPEQTGVLLTSVAAQYVSTVLTDNPLKRFAAKQLLFRGRASLSIYERAVVIDRVGEQSIEIEGDSIRQISRASASIDRGVENSGLLAITWLTGTTSVTTNLRLDAVSDTVEVFTLLNSLTLKEAQK
jgi:hypothetical protein